MAEMVRAGAGFDENRGLSGVDAPRVSTRSRPFGKYQPSGTLRSKSTGSTGLYFLSGQYVYMLDASKRILSQPSLLVL
jgi:hypothetical protein